jgi:hypothetical protein
MRWQEFQVPGGIESASRNPRLTVNNKAGLPWLRWNLEDTCFWSSSHGRKQLRSGVIPTRLQIDGGGCACDSRLSRASGVAGMLCV